MFIPRPLGIKDEESFYENLHYHIKDATRFKNIKSWSCLVVVIPQQTGLIIFMKQGSNVTLIHRRDDFRGDESLIKDIKEHANVYTPYKLLM